MKNRPDPNALDFFGVPVSPARLQHAVDVRAHTRVIAGAPPLTGAERKARALDKHEASRIKKEAMLYVRAELVKLYRERVVAWPFQRLATIPYVNADDAARILRHWAKTEVDDLPTQAWRGAIFRKGFIKLNIPTTPSLRPSQQGAALPGWKPKD